MKFISAEIKRLNNATRYSFQGFRQAWEGEAAFRFEVILATLMLPLALLLDASTMERIALVGSVLLVLIVELLNSAVEAAIDRIGSELHPLSARAKDLGSAAVFVALILAVFTWVTVLAGLIRS
ncbi:diacylglycerol kinase [Gilvimarinus sp. F26214L]|uniref:diacylglycerol kinase n=1 Tax=Gilvimarinus sp. DZF01 TaxID=3461371 RepID=UPI0040458E9A